MFGVSYIDIFMTASLI